MSTLVSADIKQYAKDAAASIPGAVNSGIASDAAHYKNNTYHSAKHHLPVPGGYTDYWPNDKTPPAENDYASAIDTSMSTEQMVRQWNYHLDVWANPNDPRRLYFAEYIGWNGKGSAERLDFGDGSRDGADDSHKWHDHEAPWRKYCASAEAFRAMLSVRQGETIEQYLNSIGQGPALTSRGMKMFAVVQVKGKPDVFEARDGKLFHVLTPEKVKALINLGANNYYAYGYGGKTGFASEAEMVDVCGPITS